MSVTLILINDTYSAMSLCNLDTNESLYDETEIDADIGKHAVRSRIWVNGILGRTANLDAAILVTIPYEPVVDAASQHTAASFKKEKRGGCIDDEGIDVWKRDVGIAEKTLLTWMENNPTLAAAQTSPQVVPSIGVERIDVDIHGEMKLDQADVESFTSILD